MEVYEISSHIMGYHEYKNIWVPQENEILTCIIEPTNPYDKYAVAVSRSGMVVGHLPLGSRGKFSKNIFFFLKSCPENQCNATITGKPFNDGSCKGMQVPCSLIFRGSSEYLKLLKKLLQI